MKKLIGGLFLMGLISVSSCKNDVEQFGDFNTPCELQIVEIYDSLGTNYKDLKFIERDTTYRRFYLKKDTIFNPDGTVDKVKNDTVYYDGKTAKLFELQMLLLPKDKNKLSFLLRSNARWTAPSILFNTEAARWISNDKVAGVCDGIIEYDVKVRATSPTVSTRRKIQTQYITTSDSSVMYKIGFTQKSMIED